MLVTHGVRQTQLAADVSEKHLFPDESAAELVIFSLSGLVSTIERANRFLQLLQHQAKQSMNAWVHAMAKVVNSFEWLLKWRRQMDLEPCYTVLVKDFFHVSLTVEVSETSGKIAKRYIVYQQRCNYGYPTGLSESWVNLSNCRLIKLVMNDIYDELFYEHSNGNDEESFCPEAR